MSGPKIWKIASTVRPTCTTQNSRNFFWHCICVMHMHSKRVFCKSCFIIAAYTKYYFVNFHSGCVIGGYRACAVCLYWMFGLLPVSEPIKESYHVSLRIIASPYTCRCQPHVCPLYRLVFYAAITTSASDVIAAASKLLPVNGRIAYVSDKGRRTEHVTWRQSSNRK